MLGTTDPVYTYQAPFSSLSHGFIIRASDGTWISLDLANRDYQAFLAWLQEGNPALEGWTGPTNETQ